MPVFVMRFLIGVLAALFAAPPAATQPQLEEAISALGVSEMHFDPNAWTIEFQLVNQSQKPVTAWVLVFISRYPEGSDAVHWVDQDSASEALLPGESRLRSLPAARREGEEPVAEVEVRPVAAVFGDGSSVGDPQHAEGIFQNREARFLELGHWIEELDKAGGATDPAAALESLQAHLRSFSGPSTFRPGTSKSSAGIEKKGVESLVDQILAQADSIERQGVSLAAVLEEAISLLREQRDSLARNLRPDRRPTRLK